MGTAGRIVGILVLVMFVSVIALRPLVANPAIAGTFRDGIGGRELLVVGPLVLVTLFVAGLRVWSMFGDDDPPHEEQFSVADDRAADREGGPGERDRSFWDDTENSTEENASGIDDSGAESPQATAASAESVGDTTGPTERGEENDSDPDDSPPGPPDILSGQGGAREREFEIEEEPPDAMLSDHLDHLQEQLDGDDTVAEDLETLEEVAEETEGDRTIPARCPQHHCDAVWTGRTVLGVGTERYELLDDGERVQCLNCEEIYRIE